MNKKSKDQKVLIIRPAKSDIVKVQENKFCTYGTTPQNANKLHINIFTFPTGDGIARPIHVMEHIDRLVNILNLSIGFNEQEEEMLRSVISDAYANKGWNLSTSECNPIQFPKFVDLIHVMIVKREKIEASTGEECVALRSLIDKFSFTKVSNYQMVFCSPEDLTNDELFEQNVIIDTSHLGFIGAKALVMGAILVKLQEYRISNNISAEEVEHTTVLECAHIMTNNSTESLFHIIQTMSSCGEKLDVIGA